MEQLLPNTARSMIPSWGLLLGISRAGRTCPRAGTPLWLCYRGELTASCWNFKRESGSKGSLWVLRFFCAWETFERSSKAKP